jgi:galactoside O-acetyltransferase
MRFQERGEDVRIYPHAKILSPERVVIGDHVIIDDFVFIGSHERLVIGSHVHIASHGSITGGGRCLIADFAGISSGARILSGTDDFSGAGLTGPTIPLELRSVERGRVVVGAHAVVGANAVVLCGVTVGEGAVIGAGSVVTVDVEPWTICVGSPARSVKARDREAILRLERDLGRRYGQPRRRYRDIADADLR